MHAGLQPLLDKQMACAASVNDVAAVQIRTLVFFGQRAVRIMTVGTCGANRQARLKQATAVDAGDIRFVTFLVAFSAELNLSSQIQGRLGIGRCPNAMATCAVAFGACHLAGDTLLIRFAGVRMQTFG
jgi:hypothetical protein